MTGPEGGSKPRSFEDAIKRVWLDILNQAVEYGSLVVFLAGTVGLELARRRWKLPDPANVALVIAEVITALTMVIPKAIRAVGEILQVLGITGHDVVHAFKFGRRRPRELGQGKPVVPRDDG